MADIDRARETFNKFDKDGDGFVTAAEYREVMAAMGDYHVTTTVAEAVIASKDIDGDKVMSFDEFWASLNK
ncbi:EF-hand domain-containing protein [Streptomyces sp. WAC06614]|uniref:EF-hand domain-containing protein n=1 Tax=Streptomyces sp. WAC06614 TaxID=2487416 RepID=UPI000F7A893F|nr:EF-hand domain-containing protein [Streptomyces sp. WAC06614]RSS84225.1 EF-hand domain-containing protein [Streptomyces sp. WAC06614]